MDFENRSKNLSNEMLIILISKITMQMQMLIQDIWMSIIRSSKYKICLKCTTSHHPTEWLTELSIRKIY